jgi:hypothetical protein
MRARARRTRNEDRQLVIENMTDRSDAYGRVMRRLRRTSEGELHAAERDAIRAACDALIFEDEDAPRALGAARDVCYALASSGRWSETRAGALLADIEACAESSVLAGC